MAAPGFAGAPPRMTDDPHPHPPAGPAQPVVPNYRWRVLLTVVLGTMASVMASTVINVAVPDMSRVFGLGQARAQWLSAGFMAAMTLSMLATPWLLGRFGYRDTYIGAISLLLAGGVLGGLSPWIELVLAMRVAEGLAAGVLQPIPAIIVMRAFEPAEQGRAMGVSSIGVVLAPAIGPSVGGVLVEWFGWRGVFFVVVPFCVAALVLARRHLPVTAPGGAATDRDGPKLDVAGLVLIAITVMALLNGMVELRGASAATGLALLACSATALIGFVFHQKRGARPLMELRLFGHRNFALGGVVAFIYGMALFGSTYLVPVFMQLGMSLPPSQAGVALLPASIVLALTIPVAGRLTDRLPFGRIVAFGLTLLAASFLLMVTVGSQGSVWWIVAWTVIGRIGLGFVLPSLNVGAMRGLPADFISQGASTINFMRQLGGAVGVSLVGIVLDWRLALYPGAAARAFHETFVLVGLITGCAALAALRMGPAGVRAPARPTAPP